MTSEAQQKAIAILPKFSGFFSACGSGFIVYDILCSHFDIPTDFWMKKDKNKNGESKELSALSSSRRSQFSSRVASRRIQRKTLRNSAYYRLMLAMSISDFIVSIAWFCTTWPIPSDENSPDNPSDKVYGNSGTMQTCTAQAFFIQFGIITPFYNALLACYYYLTIRREWKEEEFKRKVEYAGHFVSIAFGLGTSIAALVMKVFNNSIVWCWIAPYPFPTGCGNGPDQIPCERGHNANTYRWAFYYGPLWVMIVLVIIFMALVYAYVRSLDVKMGKYTKSYEKGASASGNAVQNENGDTKPNRRTKIMQTLSMVVLPDAEAITEQRVRRRNERSKAVANQGLFYAGTFTLVWSFGTITRAMQLANAKPPWAIIFLFAIFTPSQGFFNFLVYIRPRAIKYFAVRKKKRLLGSKRGSSVNSVYVSGISIMSDENSTTNPRQSSGSFRNGKFNNSDLELELSDPFTQSGHLYDDDKEGNEGSKTKKSSSKVQIEVIDVDYEEDINGTNDNNTVLFEDIIIDSNVEGDGDDDKSNPSVEFADTVEEKNAEQEDESPNTDKTHSVEEIEPSHIATEEVAGEDETPTKEDEDLSASCTEDFSEW